MANPISPLGWFLIILLVLVIVSLYVSLFSKLKEKDKKTRSEWVNSMQEAGKTIKDPFWKENSKIQELSKRIDNIQHRAGTDRNPDTGNSEVGDRE